MAKVEIEMPDELIQKIARLGNQTDQIIEKALTDGAEVVIPIAKSELSRVLKGSKYSTGQLLGSLGASKVDIDENGISNIKVGFNEPRADGKTNAMIANILEYGKSNQPARPFMRRAKRKSKPLATEAIIRRVEKEVERIIGTN